MLNKMRKVLKSEKGFTLIELITVIVILGVILGIGLPKYAKMQAQSEYDSDVTTLRNIEKAAEFYYATHIGSGTSVKFSNITSDGLFDANTVLKRVKDASTTASLRNAAKTAISGDSAITINADTGTASFTDTTPADGINDWMNTLIGVRPN